MTATCTSSKISSTVTLERFPQLDIHLMGYIQKPSKLKKVWRKRVPFVAWQDLPQRLRDIDINLAPFLSRFAILQR